MQKTSAISVRIDPELKQNVEQILQELGLTASQAVTLFYKQIELQKGLPFSVSLPETAIRQEPASRQENETRQADWNELARLVNEYASATGIDDLAAQHDHYLYGKPKR